MIINKIFLDLDDTLNDFMAYVWKLLGCVGPYDPEYGWDWEGAINAALPDRDITPEELWSLLDSYLGPEVPKSKEFDYLIRRSQVLVGRENVCVLTSMASSKRLDAKFHWIQHNLPEWLQHQVVIATEKQCCASPNALLIDDSEGNVEAFREAGGEAILMPRPWNSLHRLHTMGANLLYLMDELARFRSTYTLPELTGDKLILAQEIVREEDA
jgi:hypothetical protein